MKIKDIVPGTYYKVRLGKYDPETTRCERIQPRREAVASSGKKLGWFETPKVIVRRFMSGGYLDVPLLPRDILSEAEPDEGLLRMFAYIENEIGPKQVRNAVPNTTEES